MNNEQIKKLSGKAAAWSLLTQIAPKFVTPIINMVLARLLAPEAFGAIATINLVITFAEIFTDAGFQKYIVQHEFESDEELDNNTNVAFWTNIVVSIAFIAGIVLLRNPIANLVGSPNLGFAIAISSLNILLVTFSSTQTARYNRVMDFKTLFYARMCTVFVPLLVTVPLAFIMKNYWALLIGTVATNFINAVILTIRSKWKPRFYFSFKLFRKMFGFSAWLLLDAVLVWLTSYIGTFLIGRKLDEYYVGLYKTSITTVNSLTNIITMAIAPVMFSQLSRYQSDDVEMKKIFYTYQRLSAIILVPLGVGFFVYKDLVTWVLLGEQWSEAVDFVGIWGLTSTITIVFNNFCSTYYRSKGKPKIAMIAQFIFLIVLVPSIFLSVNHSFKALFYVRSFIVILPIIMSFIFMKACFGFKVTETVGNILPMLVSATIMGGVGFGLSLIIDSYIWDFACVAICVIVYFAVLLIFPKIRREIFSFPVVKRLLRRDAE
ncbi:MAG: lipopolysaccharide biosynthesis protein [Clostridia bacterium]|nr:lipopolysaccharide biosynthesis protein [Clostridia bacterium]